MINFQPTVNEILNISSITDFIISGFLRASHTFKIYRDLYSKLQIEGEYLPLEIPRIEGKPNVELFGEYVEAIRCNSNIRSLVSSSPGTNYTPPSTLFLEEMNARGLKTINGRSHMLGFVTRHLSIICDQNFEYNTIAALAAMV